MKLADDVHAVATELAARTTGNPFYVTQLVLDAHTTPPSVRRGRGSRRRRAARRPPPRRARRRRSRRRSRSPRSPARTSSWPRSRRARRSRPIGCSTSSSRSAGRGSSPSTSPEHFTFAHALVRDAVLGDDRHRRAASGCTAGSPTPSPPSGADPALLAHHYLAAGAARRATRRAACSRPGSAALAQAAWSVARDHFAIAADLAAEVDDRARPSSGSGAPQRALGHAAEGRSTIEIALAHRPRAPPRAAPPRSATLALVGGGGRGVAVDLEDAERATLLRAALDGWTSSDGHDDVDLLVAGAGRARARARAHRREGRTRRAHASAACARPDAGNDADGLAVALQARAYRADGTGRHPRTRRRRSRDARAPHRRPSRPNACSPRTSDSSRISSSSAIAPASTPRSRHAARSPSGSRTRTGRGPPRAGARSLAVIDGRLDEAEALAFEAFAHQAPGRASRGGRRARRQPRRHPALPGPRRRDARPPARRRRREPAHPRRTARCSRCAARAPAISTARGARTTQLAARDFELPPDSNWLLAIAVLADTAATLGDRDGARALDGPARAVRRSARRAQLLRRRRRLLGSGRAPPRPTRSARSAGRGRRPRACSERAIDASRGDAARHVRRDLAARARRARDR